MKILYSQGNFLDQRHQILAFPAKTNLDIDDIPITKSVFNKVPDIQQTISNLYLPNAHYTVDPPTLGDVIWSETGSNKQYACCIVYDDQNNFSINAFKCCLFNVLNKCKTLNQNQVGMPLQWMQNILLEWNNIYPTIELALSSDQYDCQAFVYEPDKHLLLDIVNNLPGPKITHYPTAQIRFKSQTT